MTSNTSETSTHSVREEKIKGKEKKRRENRERVTGKSTNSRRKKRETEAYRLVMQCVVFK